MKIERRVANKPETNQEKAKKKRKRKPIYPKGFDPKATNNPQPDPERWIPKKERLEYIRMLKKKGKYVKGKYDGP